ncbi:hypothetical protein BDV93DRAFT_518993, partial [Ceratobasidium sp. AG-I]
MNTVQLARHQQELGCRINTQNANELLPPEILSHIFILCFYDSNSNKNKEHWEFACETVLSSVCRHWRTVALEMALLWSRVTLSDPPPYHRSALHLSRVGPTFPLDIDIGMNGRFWDETEEATNDCAQRARDALKFIVANGGVTSRWQRVSICTDMFRAHLTVINFLGCSVMPILQHLELVFYWPYDVEEGGGHVYLGSTPVVPSLLLQSSPPQLDTIKLHSVPNALLFGHPAQPQFSNLTHLELGLILRYPHLRHFNLLLAANPQLVVLHLDMGSAVRCFRPLNRDLPRVRLPQLKELALLRISSSLWALGLVNMLDAPNIDYLQLTLTKSDGNYGQLLRYIMQGDNETTPTLLFPSLTRLMFDLSPYDCSAALEHLLSAYTEVTFLNVLWNPLRLLLDQPWLAPDLSHLRVTGATGELLGEIVDARLSAGLPLKVVEANWHSRDLVKYPELKYLKDRVDFAFVDYNGSRNDLYDTFEGGTGTVEI